MELDTTKNLTKISNKDGIWFSEHSLETVKSVWKKNMFESSDGWIDG